MSSFFFAPSRRPPHRSVGCWNDRRSTIGGARTDADRGGARDGDALESPRRRKTSSRATTAFDARGVRARCAATLRGTSQFVLFFPPCRRDACAPTARGDRRAIPAKFRRVVSAFAHLAPSRDHQARARDAMFGAPKHRGDGKDRAKPRPESGASSIARARGVRRRRRVVRSPARARISPRPTIAHAPAREDPSTDRSIHRAPPRPNSSPKPDFIPAVASPSKPSSSSASEANARPRAPPRASAPARRGGPRAIPTLGHPRHRRARARAPARAAVAPEADRGRVRRAVRARRRGARVRGRVRARREEEERRRRRRRYSRRRRGRRVGRGCGDHRSRARAEAVPRVRPRALRATVRRQVSRGEGGVGAHVQRGGGEERGSAHVRGSVLRVLQPRIRRRGADVLPLRPTGARRASSDTDTTLSRDISSRPRDRPRGFQIFSHPIARRPIESIPHRESNPSTATLVGVRESAAAGGRARRERRVAAVPRRAAGAAAASRDRAHGEAREGRHAERLRRRRRGRDALSGGVAARRRFFQGETRRGVAREEGQGQGKARARAADPGEAAWTPPRRRRWRRTTTSSSC